MSATCSSARAPSWTTPRTPSPAAKDEGRQETQADLRPYQDTEQAGAGANAWRELEVVEGAVDDERGKPEHHRDAHRERPLRL